MKFVTVAVAALAVMLQAAPADAKNFMIGDPPVAVVALPDGWEPSEYDGGVEATAPGSGAYVAVEAVKIKDVETAIKQGVRFFQKQGVTIDTSSLEKGENKIGGLPAIDVRWKGKDKDGPTNVAMTFVVLNETESVLLYLWANDAQIRKVGPELKAIADSLKSVAR